VQKAAAIEGEYDRGKSAYIDERGDVKVYTESQSDDKGGSSDQPDLTSELGLEGDICGTCGGRGIIENDEGKGPCPDCVN